MQKVTLAHNADQPISDIDNGGPADPPLGKEFRYRLHRHVRLYGNDARGHHIDYVH
jgi:hypothetical protein